MENVQERDNKCRDELQEAQPDAESAQTSEAPPTLTLERQMTGAGEDSNEIDKHPEPDELVVDWDGPKDPSNPKNWSYKRKWAATLTVSAFTFISPVSSSMVAPASDTIAQQFGVTNSVEISMMTSIFVLAYSFGPLILGPLSEIFGRPRVLQLANLFYLAWNLGCGFAQNKAQLIAFRFFAGLGGSAPLSAGGGVLADMWSAEERGKAIAIYSLAPLVGPVLGPVAGAWIAQRTTWRWVFWATTIADAVIQIIGLLFLQETFAPVLLERKANAIRKTLDLENGPVKRVRTVYDTEDRHWKQLIGKALFRPFSLFFHEPIVQLLGLYMALVYGIFYLFLTNMSLIFVGVYHEQPGIAGLHYIALGLGLTVAAQTNSRFVDRIYVHYKKRNNGIGEPEFRLPSVFPGTILLPIGLLLTGWTVQNHVHWIVPDIGIAFVGVSIILVFQSIQIYVVDTFTLHAASALASVNFFRSLCGFGFPLFAPAMYNALGFGKGNTILAVAAIVIGCPSPWLFWHFGKRIRMSSKYVRKGQQKLAALNKARS